MHPMIAVEIKKIPEHIVYSAEYDIESYNDFFDEATRDNILEKLQEQMERENPDVHVPDMPDDYNYFLHGKGVIPYPPMHVSYHDMVDRAGVDGTNYRFITVEEAMCAVANHYGSYENIGKTYEKIFRWIEKSEYTVSGPGRSSAIHGPWDCESEDDYLTEVQIPIARE